MEARFERQERRRTEEGMKERDKQIGNKRQKGESFPKTGQHVTRGIKRVPFVIHKFRESGYRSFEP
jgi:hypothetical protein